MKIEIMADRLEALGSPVRLKLFRTLVRAGDAGLPVGRLQQKLDIPASTLSHHLKRLIEQRLVRQSREGTTLYCIADFNTMRSLIGYLIDECCADTEPRVRKRKGGDCCD